MTAKLIHFTTRSLDGYIEDEQRKIDWTAPDDERWLPDGVRLGLELVDERRFKRSGVVHLHYRQQTA